MFMRETRCLLCHEVRNHVGGRVEGSGNFLEFDMLAAETNAIWQVAALWEGIDLNSQVSEKKTQIGSLSVAFRKCEIFGLLNAKADGGGKFHFSAAGGTIKEENVGTGSLAVSVSVAQLLSVWP